MNTEERFQIVRLCDGVLLLQRVAEFGDEFGVTGRNSKIVHMNAEVNALPIRQQTKEEAVVVD